MKIKQLFTTVLLSLIMFVIYVIGITPSFANQSMGILLHTWITGLICGPIYVLMISKSRTFGTVLIMNTIFAVFYLVMGSWPLFIVMMISGLLGEWSLSRRGYNSMTRPLIPYILLWAMVSFKNFFMFTLFRSAVLQNYINMGMDEVAANNAVDAASQIMLNMPLNVGGLVVTAIGCSLGFYLGKKILKAHFIPSGVTGNE